MIGLLVLALVVILAIWLTFVLFKWLFILAIVAAVVWFVFYRGRERAP
ncbi:MAG: hypothetical protein ACJ744_03650 [Gaiellaceae bacterium]